MKVLYSFHLLSEILPRQLFRYKQYLHTDILWVKKFKWASVNFLHSIYMYILFITNNVVVFHFALAYSVTNSFSMNCFWQKTRACIYI